MDSALRIGQGIVDFPQTVLDAATGQKDTRLLIGQAGFSFEDDIST